MKPSWLGGRSLRVKTLAVVCLVTAASAMFWTWCFAQLGSFLQHLGVDESIAPWIVLLRPAFSLVYFTVGMAAIGVVAYRQKSWTFPLLAFYSAAYPCLAIGLFCHQLGRIDFSMGN